MPRRKVNIGYIEDDSARKACFKKRKGGFLKKADELSTLCGVDGCAIIFSSYDHQPIVWPSESGAQHVLGRYMEIPEPEQNKRSMNQKTFTTQMFTKVKEQVVKQQMENRHKEMTNTLFPRLNVEKIKNLSLEELNEMGSLVHQNLRDFEGALSLIRTNNMRRGKNGMDGDKTFNFSK